MKKEIMGWQWHQLDHMQIICTSQQTDIHASTSLVTQFFTHWMLFLTSNQHYQSTEGNKMVIYWFVIMSFKHILNKLLLFIHSLWQGVNLNKQATMKTARVCILLCTTVVHNTALNSSDRAFFLSSGQSSCCLLEERDKFIIQ